MIEIRRRKFFQKPIEGDEINSIFAFRKHPYKYHQIVKEISGSTFRTQTHVSYQYGIYLDLWIVRIRIIIDGKKMYPL